MKTKLQSFLFFLLGLLVSNQALKAQDVTINEIMASNEATISDEDNDYPDWIEIYNYGTTPVDLNGYGLSDKPNDPYKWVFPSTTLAPNSYLIVWASDKERATSGSPLHTNFKISSSGEDVVLTSDTGTTLALAPATSLQTDISYGRQPNGTGDFASLSTPTPGATNTSTVVIEVSAPTFSHESGLYSSSFDLTLSNSNSSANIIYTLDGSEPDPLNLNGTTYNYKNEYPTSPGDAFGALLNASYTTLSYTSPINIVDRSSEANKFSNFNTNQDPPYTPTSPVKKLTIVKAKAYIGDVISETITKNYFVSPSGNPYTIPVVSLQIQEDYLFDYNKGIYTSGVDFDTWRTENPDNNQGYRPEWSNYWRSGSDWEYPMHVEVFEPENFNSILSTNAGFRIHGNNSRSLAIKNLRWYARGAYDEQDVFKFDIFDESLDDATEEGNTEFKRILMRGNGTGGSVFYDVVFHKTMQSIFPSGISRVKPAIHFINGEYWGITALRDKIDQHHYDLNYNIDSDNVSIISCGGDKCALDEGTDQDFTDYITMRDFILGNDFSDDLVFAQAEEMLDMDSFIDHIALQIFSSDDSYERSYWRARTPEDDGFGDGRWRMNIQDFEASLKGDVNWIDHWSKLTGNSDNESLFGYLLTNDSFKNKFITRFADLLNTSLSGERFNEIVNNTYNEISPYLAEDEERYPKTSFYKDSERQVLLDWGTNQPDVFRSQMLNKFALTGTHNLTLNMSDENAGYIKVNTVEIRSTTPGVSDTPYPWVGVYFNDVTTTIEAVEQQGYTFSHWSGDVSSTNKVITINPTINTQIQANYSSENAPEDAIYFWLFDDNLDNNTPLENIKTSFTSNDLEANIQYTSCLAGYPFDNSHENWRKASMERRNLPTANNYRPQANNNVFYEDLDMKGIQIKQPFQNGGLENTLTLEIPTTILEDIKVSFAVQTDGAANGLLTEYWDGSNWATTGLTTSNFSIADYYQIIEVDFTPVSYVNNNPNFKMRIRFTGDDMTSENGLRVNFNNIAVEGTVNESLSNEVFERSLILDVTPNSDYTAYNVKSNESIENIKLFNLLGQELKSLENIGESTEISLHDLTSGIYILNVTWKDKTQSTRIIKK